MSKASARLAVAGHALQGASRLPWSVQMEHEERILSVRSADDKPVATDIGIDDRNFIRDGVNHFDWLLKIAENAHLLYERAATGINVDNHTVMMFFNSFFHESAFTKEKK